MEIFLAAHILLSGFEDTVAIRNILGNTRVVVLFEKYGYLSCLSIAAAA
jgi:hypothetical protein